MSQDTTDSESNSTITVVQEVWAPAIPEDVHVMTVVIHHPPGAPGNQPHRLPGGPGFGYMIDGEMLFEIEGQPPRVLRAGDAFWGPGGDVIHYRDANNRTDIPCSFVLTLFCLPGRPMLEQVSEKELEERKGLRGTCSPPPNSDTSGASIAVPDSPSDVDRNKDGQSSGLRESTQPRRRSACGAACDELP